MTCEAQHSYWDKVFAEPSKQEWIVPFTALSALLSQHLTPADRILIVGCGVSDLAWSLYRELGCPHIISTDISEVAIEQMAAKHADTPLIWRVADATALTEFPDGSFDVVLDKGTSDTFFFRYKSNQRHGMAEKMFQAVHRVLRVGGRYIDITPRKKVPFLEKYFPSCATCQLNSGDADVVPGRDGRTRQAYAHINVKTLPEDSPQLRGSANAQSLVVKLEVRLRLLAEGQRALQRMGLIHTGESKTESGTLPTSSCKENKTADKEADNMTESGMMVEGKECENKNEYMIGVLTRVAKKSSRMYVLELEGGHKVVADAALSAEREAFSELFRCLHKGDRVCVIGQRQEGETTLFSSAVFLLTLSAAFEHHANQIRDRLLVPK